MTMWAMRRTWNLYQLLLWNLSGRKKTPPPQLVKQRIVRAYARASGATILVETGTYLGEMIEACISMFHRIYSIELDPILARAAVKRFADRPSVSIYEGDSTASLSHILAEIDEPCLFWLDAHYSGGSTARGEKETPIIEELKAVLAHDREDHVILIDDERHFDGNDGYPTVAEITQIVTTHNRGYVVSSHSDIIRIHQPGISFSDDRLILQP